MLFSVIWYLVQIILGKYLVTVDYSLQLMLSKTFRIGDTKWHI